MLISGDLYNNLTSMTQSECRHIDRVQFKGSNQPMDLYTIDISLENLQEKISITDRFDTIQLTMD